MDFKGVSLPFDVGSMLTTVKDFLGIYGEWIILVLAALFIWVILTPLIRWVARVSADYATLRDRDFDSVTPRREMYDYLTKTGRIKERDEWVRKTGNPYS